MGSNIAFQPPSPTIIIIIIFFLFILVVFFIIYLFIYLIVKYLQCSLNILTLQFGRYGISALPNAVINLPLLIWPPLCTSICWWGIMFININSSFCLFLQMPKKQQQIFYNMTRLKFDIGTMCVIRAILEEKGSYN